MGGVRASLLPLASRLRLPELGQAGVGVLVPSRWQHLLLTGVQRAEVPLRRSPRPLSLLLPLSSPVSPLSEVMSYPKKSKIVADG